MDKEQTPDKQFTAEQVEAATVLLHAFVRDMERTVGGFTETCSECGVATNWGEAMYDLLAGEWVCPDCWNTGMEELLSSHGGQERDGADSEEAATDEAG